MTIKDIKKDIKKDTKGFPNKENGTDLIFKGVLNGVVALALQ